MGEDGYRLMEARCFLGVAPSRLFMDRFGTDLGIPVMDERGVATFKPVGRRRAQLLEPMVPKPESGWNGRHAVCPATASYQWDPTPNEKDRFADRHRHHLFYGEHN